MKGGNYTNGRKKYKLVDKETGKVWGYCRVKDAAVNEKKRIEKSFFGIKIEIVDTFVEEVIKNKKEKENKEKEEKEKEEWVQIINDFGGGF